ncbi:hypothetical protein SASPL_135971 [Salvia splendens]|uniref:Uncharacterized protein n=1 Tax=Salvia splendens TaxID=180675 RepID=A0A8X8ZG84_SALSN|nr:hypothetical protein SASPL_135971 [Salvia splendens]
MSESQKSCQRMINQKLMLLKSDDNHESNNAVDLDTRNQSAPTNSFRGTLSNRDLSKSRRVKVVLNRPADAGKCSIFGSSLINH